MPFMCDCNNTASSKLKTTLCSASLTCVFDKVALALQDLFHIFHSVWDKLGHVCAGVMHQWAILWQILLIHPDSVLARETQFGPGCAPNPQAFLVNLFITYETSKMHVNVTSCFSNRDADAQALHV